MCAVLRPFQWIALGLLAHPELMQRKPTRIGGHDAGRGAIAAANDLVDGTTVQQPLLLGEGDRFWLIRHRECPGA